MHRRLSDKSAAVYYYQHVSISQHTVHILHNERSMNGILLMQGLIVAYVVIAIVFAWEGDWPKCTYWIGAAIITSSVLVMK